jgi:hypothetical protein
VRGCQLLILRAITKGEKLWMFVRTWGAAMLRPYTFLRAIRLWQ